MKQNVVPTGWLPDGSGLFVTRFGDGRYEPLLVRISKDGAASPPEPTRNSKNLAGGVAASPDGKLTRIERSPLLRATPPVLAYDLKALRLAPLIWDLMPDGRLIAAQLGAGEDDIRSFNLVLHWLDAARSKLRRQEPGVRARSRRSWHFRVL